MFEYWYFDRIMAVGYWAGSQNQGSRVFSSSPCNFLSIEHNHILYGQFSVKTLTPVHLLLKVGKPLQISFIFSLQDVLELKWQEKFYEAGPVSAQSDTCFLAQNRSFLNKFTFHLEKHIRKTWNFAQLEFLYVFLRED
jgi:hypothetical protein